MASPAIRRSLDRHISEVSEGHRDHDTAEVSTDRIRRKQ